MVLKVNGNDMKRKLFFIGRSWETTPYLREAVRQGIDTCSV